MFIYDEKTATMTTRQGDTFSFEVEGVDDTWTMFFSVYDIKRNRIFEIEANPIDGLATFNVSAAQSNKLTVSKGKKVETYYWALKRCKTDVDGTIEDTLVVQGKSVGDLTKVIVYPLVAEGFENE